ncbi:MAG: right-handed parallel beta-helix repeat-containing protein, partial [Thermoplasmata archaeon]
SKMGIRLTLLPTGNANIIDNDVYSNYFGIHISNSDTVTLGDNRIFDNLAGVFLTGSDVDMGPDNIFDDNDYGVYCTGGSNPTITDDQILNSTTIGMLFSSGAVGNIESCSISNSGGRNVYCEGGSSPNFSNCTFTPSPAGGEFFITGDSHPWVLNTTFDSDKVAFGDTASNISVNWYMHIGVVDKDGTPVPGAAVFVNDTFGNNVENRVTDAQGLAEWVVVTEYIENWSGHVAYLTPHNVEAWESARYGITQVRMTKTRYVTVMLEGAGFDMILKAGWNMISIPVNMSSTLLDDVLAPINGLYTKVQSYDINDLGDPWKSYHIDKGGMNDLPDIDRAMGIWILMKTDAIFPIVGPVPVPSNTSIELKKGWNYVGYPSYTERAAGNDTGEAFESIADNLDVVQYYDAFDAANPWKEWDYGSQTPDDLTSVKPGYGLWIHVNGTCTWDVDW